LVSEGTRIYISGKGPLEQRQVPSNVVLTGYLPRKQYEDLLHSITAVIVLTTAEDNLVCGGYEAVAAGKPLILSDTRALRELFGRGAVFTRNQAEAIAKAMDAVLDHAPARRGEVEALRAEMNVMWRSQWLQLLQALDRDAIGRGVGSDGGSDGSR
jgi:glycosyltransferase involved in cell wall biosynthesis